MKDRIHEIAFDRTSTIDDRFEALSALREDADNWDFEQDITLLTSLICAIKEENEVASHTLLLLQLYALLAEIYDEHDIYRPLDRISFEVREVLRDQRIAWDVIEETVPTIIDAISNSVYHHECYKLLLVFIKRAYDNGRLDAKLKGRVRNLLKLHILLFNDNWHSHWLDKGMQTAMANLFTQEELIKIMLNPSIGHLKVDPVEYTREWEDIYYDVEDYLNERFANVRRHMGFCFMYWSAKQDYLKEHYNIDWHSPSQMNPRVIFD